MDPQKRLTVYQALEHPWVTGKAAKFAHMDSTQKTTCVHISRAILEEGSYLRPQILSRHLRKEQNDIYIHVLLYVL